MADLNNLLDELDDSLQDDDEVVIEPVQDEEQLNDNNNNSNSDENHPPVPPALADAQARKLKYDNYDDGDDDDDDALLKELDPTTPTQLEDSPQDEDYAKLKSLWIQEMLSPELLPYHADTVSLELELLEGQEESIDKLLRYDDSNSNESQLVAEITRLDAQRTQFILQDWLALRLSKLEDHALYNRKLVHRMSDHEIQYLKSYGELLEKHFNRTILNHLPQEAWKKLDEPDMVEEPDWDRFVFCRTSIGVEIGVGDNAAEHAAGSCLIARYGAIQQLVADGSIQLLL